MFGFLKALPEGNKQGKYLDQIGKPHDFFLIGLKLPPNLKNAIKKSNSLIVRWKRKLNEKVENYCQKIEMELKKTLKIFSIEG